MKTPTPEQMKFASEILKRADSVFAVTGQEINDIQAVAEWLNSAPAIDRIPEIMNAMREMAPHGKIAASQMQSVMANGKSYTVWHGHIGENCKSAYSVEELLEKCKDFAPVTIDGMTADDVANAFNFQHS